MARSELHAVTYIGKLLVCEVILAVHAKEHERDVKAPQAKSLRWSSDACQAEEAMIPQEPKG